MFTRTGSTDDLFCYGTLMFPEVMRAVAGADYPRLGAVLRGHARYRLRGEVFPGIVAQAGAEVHGCLYRGLGAAVLRRIDAYESEGYVRRRLEVECETGERFSAWVYVMPPASRGRLDPVEWDREAFERRHLADWLRALRARIGGQELESSPSVAAVAGSSTGVSLRVRRALRGITGGMRCASLPCSRSMRCS